MGNSFAYDPVAALRNAPRLLGMELKPNGTNKLCGPYYITGEPHQYRRDKLKIFIWKGAVYIKEEGGRAVSLPTWLMEYGGATDYKDALRMIRGESQALHWDGTARHHQASEVRYVSKDVLEGARQYDLGRCPLFRWMCSMFAEEQVREVWAKYNVTTDAHNNAVFWYVNEEGKILYDKRIAYGEDGHRRKDFFPSRQFRVGDGYSAKCYYGACVPDDGHKAFLVESEKSALLASLYYGRRFLATGGKGNLRDVEPNMVLVPDIDARAEWEDKGSVWPWWEKWGIPVEQMSQTADIGDMIVWRKQHNEI